MVLLRFDMIEYKRGNLFEEHADALVNTVNCVGVMGRGIALQFKNAFPDNYKAYAAACKKQEVVPGRMFVHATGTLTKPYFIINFPTKRHWRGKSSLKDIEAGLDDLVRVVQRLGISSIAVPPLGCGLGGLSWAAVRAAMEQRLSALTNVHILVFEPDGAPGDSAMPHPQKARMTPGRAALIQLMARYIQGLLDPFITLLEVHKLLYFLQEAGEPLRLNWRKATFGPYAENLRHVLNAMEGSYITGYADGGDAPYKPLSLMSGAQQEASQLLDSHSETQARLERVFRLVEGFESSFGLELLASVHWIVSREAPASDSELIRSMYAWNARKQTFTERQILLAAHVLQEHGWIPKIFSCRGARG